jgi:hypothetical protein
MPNSSATGGFLPQLNTPLSDDALMNVIHDTISGITGIPANLVRPRWQPGIDVNGNRITPPNQPPAGTLWCGVGITLRTSTDYPQIRHINGGPDRLTRWSQLTVLASIFGPGCQGIAEQLRDGLYVWQNQELLNTVGVKVIDAGEIAAVPDLTNYQWINRADVPIHLAQAVDRDYNVLDIVESAGTITSDTGVSDPFDVTAAG